MARVIRNNDTIKITCDRCKSLIEITADDINVEDMSGGTYVICPVSTCNRSINVKNVDIPNHWRSIVFAGEDF